MSQTNNLVVKVDFQGDIRRFTQEEASLSLEGLIDTVSKAFQLNRSEVSLFYLTENGGKLEISSTSQLQHVLQLLKNKKANVLRIVVQKKENQGQTINPKPVETVQDLTASSINPLTTSIISPPPPASLPLPVTPPVTLPAPAPSPISSPSPSPIPPPISISVVSPATEKNNNNANQNSPAVVTNNTNNNIQPKSNELSPTIQEIISHPLFQQKLKENVTRTVFSVPFINLLSQALLPSLQSLIDESVKKQLESVSIDNGNVQNNNFNTNEGEAKQEQHQELLPQEKPEEPKMENPAQAIAEEKEKEEEKKAVEPVNQNNNEKENEKDSSEQENFVMVEKDQNPPENENIPNANPNNQNQKSPKAAAFLQSVLEVLSGKKSLLPVAHPKNNNPNREGAEEENEKEEPIPNLDEILKQLGDMGFTDKEANMKVLRFHKKFNEGLDEVVEDLLIQSRTNEDAKPVQQ